MRLVLDATEDEFQCLKALTWFPSLLTFWQLWQRWYASSYCPIILVWVMTHCWNRQPLLVITLTLVIKVSRTVCLKRKRDEGCFSTIFFLFMIFRTDFLNWKYNGITRVRNNCGKYNLHSQFRWGKKGSQLVYLYQRHRCTILHVYKVVPKLL